MQLMNVWIKTKIDIQKTAKLIPLYKVTLHFNCRFTKISLPAKRKGISYEDRFFNAKIHL